MQLNKILIVVVFLFTGVFAFADIALPKTVKSVIVTKYYFANVDSFPDYRFYVKKLSNNKLFKIKQDASFLLDAAAAENNKLEVWAVSRKENLKTNTFFLELIRSDESFEQNTAHVAIEFYFDKKNKLNYKQTIMKPGCFSKKKKEYIPLITYHHTNINTNHFGFIALFSFLSLISLFFINKNYQRKAYA
jgi:hypothetical protein